MERVLAFCVHGDHPVKTEVNSGSVGLHTHSCLPLSGVALTQVPCTVRSHLHTHVWKVHPKEGQGTGLSDR